MAEPHWIPVAVLPNLYTRRTVEGEIVALVPPSDVRVTTFASEHPMLGDFLARFTDTFYVPLEPVVFIVRDDAIPKFNDTQGALLSFRDLVALSVVPYARSNGLVYGGTDRISYANSFWLHPWMVESDRLVASTPAFSGFHVVQDFHGQSSPELPLMQLSELDEPVGLGIAGAIGLRGWVYGVCSLWIFRLDFSARGLRLYPLAKGPAESGARRSAWCTLICEAARRLQALPARYFTRAARKARPDMAPQIKQHSRPKKRDALAAPKFKAGPECLPQPPLPTKSYCLSVLKPDLSPRFEHGAYSAT
jgi:hypothetical protein